MIFIIIFIFNYLIKGGAKEPGEVGEETGRFGGGQGEQGHGEADRRHHQGEYSDKETVQQVA